MSRLFEGPLPFGFEAEADDGFGEQCAVKPASLLGENTGNVAENPPDQ